MNATIYKFSKDPRSTARPSNGRTINGIVFKENTSRENPVLKLSTSGLDNDYDWNYIHILGNYYYINDIVFTNNDIWELHCSIDPLATWKTEIEASTQYIVRSTDPLYKNGYINDTAYPMTNEVTTSHVIAGDNTWIASNVGRAVIGVLGPNAGDTTTYYEMSAITLTALITLLYSVDVTQEFNIGSIEVGLLKTLFDPIKYMTSCVLLPITGDVTKNTNTINTGYLPIQLGNNINIRKINSNEGYTFTATISYGNHPQAGTRGAYLNNSPYTDRVLTVMPFGTFHIDGAKLNDHANKIRLAAYMSKSDGNALLEIYTIPDSASGLHNTLAWSNAQLGIHVPLYQSDSIFKQTYSLMGAQVGTVGSVLSGNFGALPGLAAEWCGTINKTHAPDVHMVGGASGSFVIYENTQPTLDSAYYSVVPEDNNLGHMVCANYQLGGLHGLNMCQNVKLDIPAPSNEIDAIKNYMNTGIIIP